MDIVVWVKERVIRVGLVKSDKDSGRRGKERRGRRLGRANGPASQ